MTLGSNAAISVIAFTAEKTSYTAADSCAKKYIQAVLKDGWKGTKGTLYLTHTCFLNFQFHFWF